MIVETGEESYETAPGETVVFNPDTEDFNEGRIKLIPKSGGDTVPVSKQRHRNTFIWRNY